MCAGQLTYVGRSDYEVNRAEGLSLQLEVETDVENATLDFQLFLVDDPQQEDFVTLSSDGVLVIKPNATVGTFYIDVSL